MANGTIAVSSIEMLSQSGTGITTIAPPATNSNFTQTLVPVTGTLAPLVSGTAVASTSGTLIDFTGIPSWVKRITVMFSGVSTNGASLPIVQLGAGSVETSGYTGNASELFTSISTADTPASGIALQVGMASPLSLTGNMVFSLLGSNTWTVTGAVGRVAATNMTVFVGGKTLSGTLDRIRITTVNGTDTFDAGSINILYE
jgi:hypothetical protein